MFKRERESITKEQDARRKKRAGRGTKERGRETERKRWSGNELSSLMREEEWKSLNFDDRRRNGIEGNGEDGLRRLKGDREVVRRRVRCWGLGVR